MKIAGYVRQAPGRENPDSAFAQSERIRRWVLDTGHELIAVCQDHHATTSPLDRPGYRALVEIVRAEGADAVVLASLESLSPDKMLQEVMLMDLRNAGAVVIATEESDINVLRDADGDHARIVVRDVVTKVSEYREAFGLSGESDGTVMPSVPGPDAQAETTDVVVELIAPTG